MKREGRIHGCNVRLGKRAWGYGGYGGKIVTSKPTNQSKNSMKRPVVPSVAHIVHNEREVPSQKSIGKTKSAFKAKDLDITRNHLMQDWSIYKRGLAVEENYDDEDDEDDGTDDAYIHHDEHRRSDDYRTIGGYDDDDDEEEEYEQEEQQEGEEQYWEAAAAGSRGRNRGRTEIILPIESLLTMRKRKIVRNKANTVNQQQQQQLPLTINDVGGSEIVLEEGDVDVSDDEFESWWGLGFYDEEEVPDDWFLISEREGFVAA